TRQERYHGLAHRVTRCATPTIRQTSFARFYSLNQTPTQEMPASVAPFAGSYSIAQWSLPGGTRRLTWVVRHASCPLPCWYPRTADPGPTLSASANSTTIRRLAGFFGREGPTMCVPRYAVSPMERLVSLRDTTGHGKPAPWQGTARTPPTETETSIAPA